MAFTLEEQIQKNYLGLAVMFLVLTALTTALRFWSRKLRSLSFGLDDWLAMAALFFFWAEVGVHLWGLFGAGVGKHIQHATKEELIETYKELTTVEYPYTLALSLIRISIAVLLLRVFSAANWFRWAVYASIVLNVAWGLFIIFDAFFICIPFNFNWNQTIPGGHCADKTTHFIVMGVWGVINDLIVWGLPQAVVWRLQMDMVQKLIISAVFAIGIFDVVVGIVRIVALSNLAPPPGDWTHSLAPVEIWSYIEAGTVICIANIPLCKPIAERIMPRTFLTWAKRSYGRSGYTPNPRSGKNQPSESAGRKFEDDEFQLFPGKGGNHAVSARRDLESGPIGREWQHLDDVDSLEHDGIRMTQNITVTEERAR